MKKIVMILAMAATVTLGYAQDDKKCCGNCDKQQPPTKEQMMQRITDELGLTDQQAKDLAALNEEYADVLEGPGHHGPGHHGKHGKPGGKPGMHRQQPQADQQLAQAPQRPQLTDEQRQQMQAKREQAKVRRDEYDQKVQQILTAEQYEKMKTMRPQRGPRPEGRPAKNKKKVSK